MKLPDNSPTLTSGVPNPQKASPRRVLSKAERCALLVASVAWFQAGCTGVQTRPDPGGRAPRKPWTRWRKSWGGACKGEQQPVILVDVTKGAPSADETRRTLDAVFKDGPVTGELIRAEGKAPEGTRLEGHLWTTGDRIYGRYLRAHLPGGRTVPICVESDGPVGMDKREGSKPGHAVGSKVVNGLAVERWH